VNLRPDRRKAVDHEHPSCQRKVGAQVSVRRLVDLGTERRETASRLIEVSVVRENGALHKAQAR